MPLSVRAPRLQLQGCCSSKPQKCSLGVTVTAELRVCSWGSTRVWSVLLELGCVGGWRHLSSKIGGKCLQRGTSSTRMDLNGRQGGNSFGGEISLGSPSPCSSSTGTAWSARPHPWLPAAPALPRDDVAEEEEEGGCARLGKGTGAHKRPRWGQVLTVALCAQLALSGLFCCWWWQSSSSLGAEIPPGSDWHQVLPSASPWALLSLTRRCWGSLPWHTLTRTPHPRSIPYPLHTQLRPSCQRHAWLQQKVNFISLPLFLQMSVTVNCRRNDT